MRVAHSVILVLASFLSVGLPNPLVAQTQNSEANSKKPNLAEALNELPDLRRKYAGGGQTRDLSAAESARLSLQFARCVFEKDKRKSTDLLSYAIWNEELASKAGRLAINNKRCAKRGSIMVFHANLFKGFLAEAALRDELSENFTEDLTSEIKRIFTISTLPSDVDLATRSRHALLGFAECVYRNDRERVLYLLTQEPFSDEEGLQFKILEPLFSSCLMTDKEEMQLEFSRPSLRGLLAEAAYEVTKQRSISLAEGSN